LLILLQFKKNSKENKIKNATIDFRVLS